MQFPMLLTNKMHYYIILGPDEYKKLSSTYLSERYYLEFLHNISVLFVAGGNILRSIKEILEKVYDKVMITSYRIYIIGRYNATAIHILYELERNIQILWS
jgi:hypothetical protein